MRTKQERPTGFEQVLYHAAQQTGSRIMSWCEIGEHSVCEDELKPVDEGAMRACEDCIIAEREHIQMVNDNFKLRGWK